MSVLLGLAISCDPCDGLLLGVSWTRRPSKVGYETGSLESLTPVTWEEAMVEAVVTARKEGEGGTAAAAD